MGVLWGWGLSIEGRRIRGLEGKRAGGFEGWIGGWAGTQKIGGRGGATPLPWFALRRTEAFA